MPALENVDIRSILPHRYPMLLVDRILEISEDRVVGIKNVTANEPFFAGHFPNFPVMPGVLIVESMAQVAGVLALQGIENREQKLVFFASIEEAKFRKPVLPGDTLRIEMEILRRKPSVVKARGTAKVGDSIVAEATVLCSIVDRDR
jgi:beta-hydroxyacyl-ACP dehydratase FabZ